jgi:hypothetical protein
MLTITLGLAPVESGCFKPWAAVLNQDVRQMVGTDRETAEKSDQDVAVASLSGALAWEHPREKASVPYVPTPRPFIYPMEAAYFMERVKAGRQHTLSEEFEQIGPATASVCRASLPCRA